ncbi:MAG: glycine zipper 2TM domain-containing protein [Pseudomonadota bacterium]
MRKFLSIISATALLVPAFAVPSTPAEARSNAGEWRGKDGRLYCRKSNGTVGLVVGAAGGALIGRAVDTRGDRATGTIIGAAGGALLGREIAKKRRCR